jgi:mono/diheme cytochrome c family protein
MNDFLSKLVGFAALATIFAVSLSIAFGADEPPAEQAAEPTVAQLKAGAAIYVAQCVECHGDKGQGVEGAYEKALGGDRTLDWLTRRIDRTMPEGESDQCVGEDAKAVAAYLHQQFYASDAPGKATGRTLQRLTVEQHRQSLADLIGSFREAKPIDDQRGLWTQVYAGRGMRKKDKTISEAVSATLDAAYSPEHPLHAQFDEKGHSVRWSGSLLATETGEYEIVVHTDQAMRLWLNDGKAQGGGISNEMTDTNSVALLDGWLQSAEKTEFRAKVFLLAGRAYPIMLEFSAHNQGVGREEDQKKHKGEDTSYIRLHWVPPGGVEQVIPQRHLYPKRAPEVFVASNPFPPDDASMGFISGAGVSEAWLNATTQSAIQAADHVVAHLNELVGTHPKAKDRRYRVMRFCRSLVEQAYRRPISDEENEQYVVRHFDDWNEIKPATKRVVLSALISPHFLYPRPATDQHDAFDTAASLALAMWDGLPDKTLRYAAVNDELATAEQLEAHARRMLDDPRAKAKLIRFFHHWLELERAEYVDKDKHLFPEFDEQLLADLRTSLELFIEHTVFSEKSDYRDLLLADYLYVNPRIAEVYGIERGDASERAFTRVDMPSDRRSGVITHPYLLTAFAYHNSTSPIHRGVFLTRNIIGRPLNPPPNAIAFDGAEFDPDLTMREKVTAFTRDSACMACHETINPLGFSLEHYDSLGRWRTQENDKPINAASDFMGDDGKTHRLKGARDVAQYAVASEAAHRVFVRQLFQHTHQRDPSALSPETLGKLTADFQNSDFHIRDLFVRIAIESAMQHIESDQKKDTP